MSTNRNYNYLSLLFSLLVLSYSCFCIARELDNSPVGALRLSSVDAPAGNDEPFNSGVATWYGDATGPGSGNFFKFIFTIN